MRRLDLIALLITVLAGVLVGMQPAINGRLRGYAGDAALAALVSTLTSSTLLLTWVLLSRPVRPSLAHMASAPWWIWTGGILGAVYVAVSLNFAQRLGTATLLAAALGGQMLSALLLDHFGWFGLPDRPISLPRIVGVGFVFIGIALIRRF